MSVGNGLLAKDIDIGCVIDVKYLLDCLGDLSTSLKDGHFELLQLCDNFAQLVVNLTQSVNGVRGFIHSMFDLLSKSMKLVLYDFIHLSFNFLKFISGVLDDFLWGFGLLHD